MQILKKQIIACLVTLMGFAIFATLMQVLVKPMPKAHPLFPFITLEDKTLPFFNQTNFHNSVYAWYALDDMIAARLAIHQSPFGSMTPKIYHDLLLKAGDTDKTSPLTEIIPTPLPEDEEDSYLYRVDTNSYGFRSPEFALKKPPQTIRIVAAGDSLTFGFGLEEEKTWVKRLQKSLQESAPKGTNVEVINAGVIAFDSTLGKELMARKIIPLNPDWVIVGYGYNDYNFANRSFLGSKGPSKNPQETFWDQQISRKKTARGQMAYLASQLRIVQMLRVGMNKIISVRRKSTTPAFAETKKNLQEARGQHVSTPEQYKRNLEHIVDTLQAQKIHVLLLNSNVTSPIYLPSLQEIALQKHVPLVDFHAILSKNEATKHEMVPTLFRVKLPTNLASTKPKVYLLGDYFSNVEIGATELNDRAEDGDRVADDGIYSATLPILRGTLLSFHFAIEGANFQEEFEGWRIYRRFEVRGETVSIAQEPASLATPIYSFNDLSDHSYEDYSFKSYMSEICHPNGKGNQLIAQTLHQTLKKELAW